jgi:tetratricopeptide (TPR) repeat protein
LPRWRNPRDAYAANEARARETPAYPLREDVEEAEIAWTERRERGRALDLVSAAATMPDPSPSAREAAEWLIRDGRPTRLARIAAERVLDPTAARVPEHAAERDADEEAQARKAIRRARRLTEADPRNAIAWAERSRHHASLGQKEPAIRSMRRALALAPEHRYFLRAGARLYVHIERPDLAHSLLCRALRTPSDPWLLAPEIAIAELAERPPAFLRAGRRLVEEGGWAPAHLTELAAAIGTLELRGGRDRKARSLFSASLEAPNDNALAQAEWASEGLGSVRRSLAQLGEEEVPLSYEALSLAAISSGERETAVNQAWLWLLDQPFSTQPASFGSYHAGAMRDFERSLAFARRGLMANHSHPMLRNNAAFALAQLGRIEEAAAELEAVREGDLDVEGRAVISATRGLLSFRRGEAERGQELYGKAIREATDPTVQALATLMFVSELLRLRLPNAAEEASRAREQAERTLRPVDRGWLDYLEEKR